MDQEGLVLAAMSGERRVSIWNRRGQLLAREVVPAHDCSELDLMALGEDRVLLAVGESRYRLLGDGIALELPRLSARRHFLVPGYDLATSLGFVDHGRWYFRAKEQEVWILDLKTGKRLSQLTVGPWRSLLPFTWCEFSDDGGYLAIAAGIDQIEVLGAKSLVPLGRLRAKGNIVALAGDSLILETLKPTGATWVAYGLKPFGKKLWTRNGIKALTARATTVLGTVGEHAPTSLGYLGDEDARLDHVWWVETSGIDPLSSRQRSVAPSHFPWLLGYDVRPRPNEYVVVDTRTGLDAVRFNLDRGSRIRWRWMGQGLDVLAGSEAVTWREGERPRQRRVDAGGALDFVRDPTRLVAGDGIWDIPTLTRHCAFAPSTEMDPWSFASAPKAILGHRFESDRGDESYAAWDSDHCHQLWEYRLVQRRLGSISFNQEPFWPWLSSDQGVLGHLDGAQARVYAWAPVVTSGGLASFVVFDRHCWDGGIQGLSFSEPPSWLPTRSCPGLAEQFRGSLARAVEQYGPLDQE
jgi:hypothetical protein